MATSAVVLFASLFSAFGCFSENLLRYLLIIGKFMYHRKAICFSFFQFATNRDCLLGFFGTHDEIAVSKRGNKIQCNVEQLFAVNFSFTS